VEQSYVCQARLFCLANNRGNVFLFQCYIP